MRLLIDVNVMAPIGMHKARVAVAKLAFRENVLARTWHLNQSWTFLERTVAVIMVMLVNRRLWCAVVLVTLTPNLYKLVCLLRP